MRPRMRQGWIVLGVAILISGCATPSASAPSSSAIPSGPVAGSPGGTASTPSASPSVTPSSSVVSTPSPVPPPSGTTYTVRAGDSLSAIALAFSKTTEQLVAWNAGRYPSLETNPGIIEPGWVLMVSEQPGATPRPLPTAAPTPQPPPPATQPPAGIGCTAGNRVAAGSAQTFTTIPNAGPGVALTFDMGGRMDPAVDIMNLLVANKVCATIFATGIMAQSAQGQEVMVIIKAHPELFEIANHTMYHCDLARGGGGSPSTGPCQTGGPPSADFIRKELTDAEAILRAGTGQSPQPYWRPPYGSVNAAVINAAASVGYTKTFMWDIDTVDWKPTSQGGPSAQQIASKVINNAVNGSNVLFHLGGYETHDALQIIIPGLRDRGFKLTSLSDLLH